MRNFPFKGCWRNLSSSKWHKIRTNHLTLWICLSVVYLSTVMATTVYTEPGHNSWNSLINSWNPPVSAMLVRGIIKGAARIWVEDWKEILKKITRINILMIPDLYGPHYGWHSLHTVSKQKEQGVKYLLKYIYKYIYCGDCVEYGYWQDYLRVNWK